MSYKKPSYELIDNDQTVNYITPNVVVLIAAGAVIAISSCSKSAD